MSPSCSWSFFTILSASPTAPLLVTCDIYLFKKILMWTVFKVFVEFVMTLLVSYGFAAVRHVRSYLPDEGLNLQVLHWKAKS